METIVYLAQDCPKDGWPKSGALGMFAGQGDVYSYCSRLRKTSSDLSEQMRAIGGFYLPAHMLPYGSHISTEKHFLFATSVMESGPSRYNNIKYPTAPTWHHSAAFSQTNHQSRDVHSLEGVLPKRDELPVCRTTPVARASSLTHSLQRPKTSKRSTNTASTGVKERSSPATQKFSYCKESSSATQKFSSCKDSDVCARGAFYMEDEVHVMSFEPMHSRLANKALERVDCNIPWTASSEPYQILPVRAKCIKKDGKESTTSINDAPLDRIKGGQYSSMNTSEAKAIMRLSRPSSKRDIYENHCDGLVPFDPVVTSALITPLAIKGSSQEVSQIGHCLAMNERWAGPAFSNSPPPSLLPVPAFTRRQSRTSSLEIPRAQAEFLAVSICVSAPGTPSRSFSLPNVGAFPSHLDTNRATQSLRRLLNLDLCT